MNVHKLLAFYTLVCLFKAKEKPTERQNRRWVDFKQSKSERERLPCPRYAFGFTDKGAHYANGGSDNDQRNNCRAPMRPREAPAVYVPFAETENNKENETNNGN